MITFIDELVCNYDVIKYGSCMIDDLLFDMLYDNSFEMIFWNYYHSLKKDCADRPFEITYFSISGQHNLLKAIFYVPRFEMIDDYHLQMRGQNFRTQNYFRQEFLTQFIDENAPQKRGKNYKPIG